MRNRADDNIRGEYSLVTRDGEDNVTRVGTRKFGRILVSGLIAGLVFFYYVEGLLRKVVLFQFIKYSLVVGIVGLLLYLMSDTKRTRRWRRWRWVVVGLVVVLTGWDSFSWLQFRNRHILTTTTTTTDTNNQVKPPQYFIAGNLFNSEPILPHYINQLNQFINLVGSENVYISIVEDHSKDITPKLLTDWGIDLTRRKVKHFIRTDFDIPPPGSLKRIEKLAYLRNAALQPFFSLPDFATIGETSPGSKVIFLNDILFFMEDLVKLVNTGGGSYDAACATDYDGVGVYDIWVLRDRYGGLTSPIEPIFEKGEDRLTWQSDTPVPVYSCWNGVVVFAWPLVAHQFSPQLVTPQPFTTHPDFRPTPTSNVTTGVRFRTRSSPDECHSSECLLLFHDLRQLHPSLHVLLNPTVRVGYQLRYYFLWRELLNWRIVRWVMATFLPTNLHRPLPIPHRDAAHYQCY